MWNKNPGVPIFVFVSSSDFTSLPAEVPANKLDQELLLSEDVHMLSHRISAVPTYQDNATELPSIP